MRRQLLRYLARVFVLGPRVDVSGPGMARFAYAIGSPLLAPATIKTAGPPRAALVTENHDFLLGVNSEGFDLQFSPIDGSASATSFAEFCQRAAEWLGASLKFTGQAAYRVSAVREHLFLELGPEEFARARSGLLSVPNGLGEVEPFQWDFRIALQREQEIGGEKEVLFVVPTVKRVEAGVNAERFDTLLMTTDVNTSPKQVVARFKGEQVKEFFDASPGWHDGAERAILDATGLT